MRSGIYRHNVAFQRRSTTQDHAGQQLDVWLLIGNRKVSIEPINGHEFFSASGERADITVRVKCRYDPVVAAVRPYDRMVRDTTIYNITAVLPQLSRHDDIQIMCAQVVDNL